MIPRIDPSVVHIPLGTFKRFTAEEVPQRTFVLLDSGHKPIAVSVPYETFLEMQRHIAAHDPVAATTGRMAPPVADSPRLHPA